MSAPFTVRLSSVIAELRELEEAAPTAIRSESSEIENLICYALEHLTYAQSRIPELEEGEPP